MLVTGAVDDLWENARGELIVVDYKSTAKAAEITELNEEWHAGYKRQIEIYQWLLRQNGFTVSVAKGDAALFYEARWPAMPISAVSHALAGNPLPSPFATHVAQ